MRVTQATTAALMAQGLDDTYSQFETLSAQISSGQAITRPSDNPAGTVQAMTYRAEITRVGQYQSNASDGLAWLGTADSTLSSVQTQLQRVQTLVLQAANSTTDATGRAAIATEVDSIRASLLADANANYLGRPIFGGTTGGAQAFDGSGNYVGDNGVVTRTVADNTTVQVNLTGTDVFGSGSSGVFAVLSQISDHLRSSDPTQVANLGTSDLNALQSALGTVTTAQGTVGARYNQVQTIQNQAQARQTTLTTALSGVQDLDMAKAETQLSTQQLTYQAALEATARVLSLSLTEFLK
jgi:flagellar hook-associated protein 3 FlgL